MRKGLSKSLACLVALITVTSNSVVFAQDMKKDETVYVILDENGNPTEQIVSDWIKGSENLEQFTDKSTLSDVKNVKGDEEPTKNGDELSWNIDSNELYYQGKSNNQLPITVSVNYEFNGKKVDPKEVLGEEGQFKISVNIANNESKRVYINNAERNIYLPILTVAELTLSNSNFSNVEVNSGKILNDGNNSLLTFVTVPGLKESLDLDNVLDDLVGNSSIDLSDSFEITGETDNFEIPSIMVLATISSADIDDIENIDSLDDLRSSLNDLQKGGEDLLSGSKELLDGQTELASNYSIFNTGVGTLNSGAIELRNGINTLNASVPTLLSGVNSLNNGAGKIKANYDKFDKGVTSLATGANNLNDGVNTLSGSVPTLNHGAVTLNSGVNELQGKYTEFDSGVSSLADGTKSLDTGVLNLEEGVKDLNSGAKELNGGLGTLKSSQEEFTNGVNEFVGGVNELNSNYSSIDSGINSALDGVIQLNNVLQVAGNGIGEL